MRSYLSFLLLVFLFIPVLGNAKTALQHPSICDNSAIQLTNTSDRKVIIEEMFPSGNTQIELKSNKELNNGDTAFFVAQSGKHSMGHAKGTIQFLVQDPMSGSQTRHKLSYEFIVWGHMHGFIPTKCIIKYSGLNNTRFGISRQDGNRDTPAVLSVVIYK